MTGATLWPRSSSSFDFTQITFLFVSTVVQKRSYYWKPVSSKSEIRVTEIDSNLWYATFSTACFIVYKYCTWPIRRHLYSRIFKDSLDKKYKKKNFEIFFSNLFFHGQRRALQLVFDKFRSLDSRRIQSYIW